MMGDVRRYSAFAAQPVPGSAYDFYVAATGIRDQEPTVPLGAAPEPVRSDMDLWERRFWERHNPFLEEVALITRRHIIDELRAVGIPPDSLVEPLSPAIESYVSKQITIINCNYLQCEQEIQRKLAGSKRKLSPEKRVLVGARLCSGGTAEAARRLNEGIKLSGPKRGLDCDHVYRAVRTFKRLPDYNAHIFRAEILLYVDNFRTLRYVRATSVNHPSFRGLDGHELAEAIHEQKDLWHVCDRVRNKLPSLRGLLAA